MAVEATFAAEIVLVIQQIINYAAVPGFKHAAVLPSPADRHRQAGNEPHIVPQLLRNILVHGHNDPAANQPLAQRLRQGPRHIT